MIKPSSYGNITWTAWESEWELVREHGKPAWRGCAHLRLLEGKTDVLVSSGVTNGWFWFTTPGFFPRKEKGASYQKERGGFGSPTRKEGRPWPGRPHPEDGCWIRDSERGQTPEETVGTDSKLLRWYLYWWQQDVGLRTRGME